MERPARRRPPPPPSLGDLLAAGVVAPRGGRLNAASRNVGSLGVLPPAVDGVTTLLLGGNPLRSLRGVGAFAALETLSLAACDVDSLAALAPLSACPRLRALLLDGTPLSRLPLARERVVALLHGAGLRVLDGVEITPAEADAASALVGEYAAALAAAVAHEAAIVAATGALRLTQVHTELLQRLPWPPNGGGACDDAVPHPDCGPRLAAALRVFDTLPPAARDAFVDGVERTVGRLLAPAPHRAHPVQASHARAAAWVDAARALCAIQARVRGDVDAALAAASQARCAAGEALSTRALWAPEVQQRSPDRRPRHPHEQQRRLDPAGESVAATVTTVPGANVAPRYSSSASREHRHDVADQPLGADATAGRGLDDDGGASISSSGASSGAVSASGGGGGPFSVTSSMVDEAATAAAPRLRWHLLQAGWQPKPVGKPARGVPGGGVGGGDARRQGHDPSSHALPQAHDAGGEPEWESASPLRVTAQAGATQPEG